MQLLHALPVLLLEDVARVQGQLRRRAPLVLRRELLHPGHLDGADAGGRALAHLGDQLHLVRVLGLHRVRDDLGLVVAPRLVVALDAPQVRLPRVRIEVGGPLGERPERLPPGRGRGEDLRLDVPRAHLIGAFDLDLLHLPCVRPRLGGGARAGECQEQEEGGAEAASEEGYVHGTCSYPFIRALTRSPCAGGPDCVAFHPAEPARKGGSRTLGAI